jgi:signal transduction histidine kinase
MKNLGIYNRILLTTIVIGIIFLLLLLTLYLIKDKQEKIIMDESTDLFSKEVNSLLALKTDVLQQVVYDYTFYDDFVENLAINDSAWYENNITTILKSFHLEYVCVYDTSFNVVLEVSSDGVLSRRFIAPGALAKLRMDKFMNFFQNTGDGMVQISGGSVHPDIDPTHTLTKPSGYLFIAKSWNKDFLRELAVLSGAKVDLVEHSDPAASPDNYSISQSVPLLEWDGKEVAKISFTRSYNSLRVFHRLSAFMILIMLGSALACFYIFHIITKRWLEKPLKLVAGILKTEDFSQVEELRNSHGEFKMIGALFGDFIQQKKVLKLTKERAEESDKLKTAFLNNISHEIRTPFSGILGFLNLIIDNQLSEHDRADYAEMINQSSNRLMNTIDNIVEIAQIQAGQMEVTKSEINVNQLINSVIAQFKVEAEHKNLKLTFINGLPGNMDSLLSDWKKIDAILSNLIDNALKFTKEGSVEVGLRLCGPEDVFPHQFLFYVKDTGIGILPEKQSRIFDLFIQADGSDTRSFDGCGLGLAISKAYVEMLDGKIWAESNLTGPEGTSGTTFYFTIHNFKVQTKNIPPDRNEK